MMCGLALALLLDASGSVTDQHWQTQVEAHADALASPRIGELMAAAGITVVSVIAYDDRPRVLVPWRVVDAPADAQGVAREVMAAQRPGQGRTMTGAALSFTLDHITRAPCEPERVVIDVVTDGPNDDGAALAEARERAIMEGARVNVLVVNTYDVNAAAWARERLASPSGFVMEADTWQQVSQALRRKMTMEISQR